MTIKPARAFDREYFHYGRGKQSYRDYSFVGFYPQFQFLATWIKDNFNPRRVLDIGCAKGFLVKAFREIGIEAYGVDISHYAISNSFEDTRPYLYELDVSRDVLPFPDGYFDFITFLQVIEYLSDYKHCLREIKRVTRDGAGIYLTSSCLKNVTKDELMINIHDKDYWIKEFHSNGFRFAPEKVDSLIKAESDFRITLIENILTLAQTHATSSENTIKLKLGKYIYQKGGYIGRKLVIWAGARNVVQNPNFGSFCFIKE